MGDHPYLGVCYDPYALSHEEIHRQFQGARPDTGRVVVDQLRREVDGVQGDLDELRACLDRLFSIWTAESTERGVEAFHRVRDAADKVQDNADEIGARFGTFFDELATAKTRLPEPVNRLDGVLIPIVGPARMVANEILHHIRTGEAREIYARAYQVAEATDGATPAFEPPPRTTSGEPAATDASVRPLATATRWPGRVVAGRQPAASGPSVAGPQPGTAPTATAPAQTIPSVGVGPVPGHAPGGDSGTPWIGGPGPAPAAAPEPLPLTRGGGPTGQRFDTRLGSGAGFGAGSGGTGGSGGLGTGGGPGAGGPGREPGGRPTGGTGAGPASTHDASRAGTTTTRGPMAAGPLGTGTSAGREEDREHTRAKFLIADDPNELVGPLDTVAPAVIGLPSAGDA